MGSLHTQAAGPTQAATIQITIDTSRLVQALDRQRAWRYRNQYVMNDERLLVVGLYDTSSASSPVFGTEVSSASTAPAPESTTQPSYDAALVGVNNSGTYVPGALDLGYLQNDPYGLTPAEIVDFSRVYYSDIATPLALPSTTTVSFANVPGNRTYVAFAAALSTPSFDTNYPASDTYVDGVASTSIAPAPGNDSVSLPLDLDRNTNSVDVTATFANGTLTNLSSIQAVVIGIVATNSVSATGIIQPLSFGYDWDYGTTAGPTPYPSPSELTGPPTSPADYPANVESTTNNGAVGLPDSSWSRFIWTTHGFSSTYPFGGGSNPGTLTATFLDLPESLGGSEDYRAFAIAFATCAGADTFSTVLASESAGFALSSSPTPTTVALPSTALTTCL